MEGEGHGILFYCYLKKMLTSALLFPEPNYFILFNINYCNNCLQNKITNILFTIYPSGGSGWIICSLGDSSIALGRSDLLLNGRPGYSLTVGTSFFFALALLLSILPLLFLPSSLSVSYFILAVAMRKCYRKYSCMSSIFNIDILNGTCFFRKVK